MKTSVRFAAVLAVSFAVGGCNCGVPVANSATSTGAAAATTTAGHGTTSAGSTAATTTTTSATAGTTGATTVTATATAGTTAVGTSGASATIGTAAGTTGGTTGSTSSTGSSGTIGGGTSASGPTTGAASSSSMTTGASSTSSGQTGATTSSGQAGATTSGGSSTTGSGGLGCGFAAAGTPFPLPPGYSSDTDIVFYDLLDSQVECGSTQDLPRYSLVDLNGDGKPDLVVTEGCSGTNLDLTGIGTSYWLVYFNTGTGFSPTAAQFPLPTGYSSDTDIVFYDVKDTQVECGTSQNLPRYSLVDMNGDGKPDLVVTEGCSGTDLDLTGIGTSYWLVYFNTGTGFSPTGAQFPLPTGYSSDTDIVFYDLLDTQVECGTGEDLPRYSLVDLNGDGKPDLVVTEGCSGTNLDLTGIGTSYWLVYFSTGTGFSATATQFPLPTGYSSDTDIVFYDVKDDQVECGSTQDLPRYSLVDLNGDGKPDLVVTEGCSGTDLDLTGIGTSYWLVYFNTGTGFSPTGAQFPLPTGYSSDTDIVFYDVKDAQVECGSTQDLPRYSLIDMNGDGKPDLVVTEGCSGTNLDLTGIGTSYWLVYLNTGTGFSPTGAQLPLPTGYSSDTDIVFYDVKDNQVECGSTQDLPRYSLVDLNGDGLPDIVGTEGCSGTNLDLTGIGTTYWLLNGNDCR